MGCGGNSGYDENGDYDENRIYDDNKHRNGIFERIFDFWGSFFEKKDSKKKVEKFEKVSFFQNFKNFFIKKKVMRVNKKVTKNLFWNNYKNKIVKKISKKKLSKKNPFLVQTNHDWWLDTEGGDKLDDGLRRKSAIIRIKELYKNGEINVENLFNKIMSQENNKNEDTVFTTLVDLDYYNQYYDTRIY